MRDSIRMRRHLPSLSLRIIAHGNRLLDEHVQILGDLSIGCAESCFLQRRVSKLPEYTCAGERRGHELDLGDAVQVAQDDADQRRRSALARELGDLLGDRVGRRHN